MRLPDAYGTFFMKRTITGMMHTLMVTVFSHYVSSQLRTDRASERGSADTLPIIDVHAYALARGHCNGRGRGVAAVSSATYLRTYIYILYIYSHHVT